MRTPQEHAKEIENAKRSVAARKLVALLAHRIIEEKFARVCLEEKEKAARINVQKIELQKKIMLEETTARSKIMEIQTNTIESMLHDSAIQRENILESLQEKKRIQLTTSVIGKIVAFFSKKSIDSTGDREPLLINAELTTRYGSAL